MKMKSGGMLIAAPECYERSDGVDTLLVTASEPLDLRLCSRHTDVAGSKPGTDNSGVNKSQRSKLDEDLSKSNHQPQTSVSYAETEKIHMDSRATGLGAKQGISVVRPTPIYCCRSVNPAASNTRVTNGDDCSSKTIYHAASMLNLESSYNSSSLSNVPLAGRRKCETKFGRGMMGIFSRKGNQELMKLDRWNCGPKFGQEVTGIVNRNAKCELMKFENGDIKSQDDLLPDGGLSDHNGAVTFAGQNNDGQMGSSIADMVGTVTSAGLDEDYRYIYDSESFEISGAVTSDGKNKVGSDLGTYPADLREGTDNSSENDNSFEVLFEYITNRDRQSSSESPTIPYAEELEDRRSSSETKYYAEELEDRQSSSETTHYAEELEHGSSQRHIPVLQGCEDILEPKPLKERFVGGGRTKERFVGGRRIPELVEPVVSPTLDCMEGCRFSPFSVFGQFSNNSKRPNPILSSSSSSSSSYTSSEDEEEDEDEEAPYSPQTNKPVATVFPFQEDSMEMYSTFTRPALSNGSTMIFHTEHFTNQQGNLAQNPTTSSADLEVGVKKNTAWDLSTSRNRTSLHVPLVCADDRPAEKPADQHNPVKRLLYSHKPLIQSFLHSQPTETIVSSSQLESIHSLPQTGLTLSSPEKESSVFSSYRESVLPSLHRKSIAMLPSLTRESTLFQNRGSNLSPSPTESTLSPSLGESTQSSSRKEPTSFPRRESTTPTLHRKSKNLSSDNESSLTFPYKDFVPKRSGAKTGLNLLVKNLPANFESESSTARHKSQSISSHYEQISAQKAREINSAFKLDFERDMKSQSSFSINLEDSGQRMSKEMINTGQNLLMRPSTIPISARSKLQNHLSSVPNSPILTSMPNSPTLISMPNSPILESMPNSSILTSMPNSPTLISMPNSPTLISMPNSPNLCSMPNSPILTSMPNSPILTSSVPNLNISPNPETVSSVSNLKGHKFSPLPLPNSPTPKPTPNTVSPYCTTEKPQQQETRLSPPMKHKQMLIQKYEMSVNAEKPDCKPGIDKFNMALYEDVSEEKPAFDSPRTVIAAQGRKHKLKFQSNENLSFSESEKQENPKYPAKERKVLNQESVDYCESAESHQSLQPCDLEPCETFYWCHVCEKTIKCETDANRHQNVHGYNTKANLLYYYLQVYGCVTLHWRGYNWAEKCVYLCGLCDRTIPYISGFKRHIQTHGTNVCCDVCNKYFDNTENLLEHKLSHSESKSCDQEGSRVFATRGYKLHANSRSNGSSETFKCRYCGKSMSSRSSLTIHVRIHTGQNPYKCRLCERSYPQNVQLKLHMKAHRGLGDI